MNDSKKENDENFKLYQRQSFSPNVGKPEEIGIKLEALTVQIGDCLQCFLIPIKLQAPAGPAGH